METLINKDFSIQEFTPDLEEKLQCLENSFVSTSQFAGLIRISRSFQVSYSDYFLTKYHHGFILVAEDAKKNVIVISELRSNNEVVQKELIEKGLERAQTEFGCSAAYYFLSDNSSNNSNPFEGTLQRFDRVSMIESAISLQNKQFKLESVCDSNRLVFAEISPDIAEKQQQQYFMKNHKEQQTQLDCNTVETLSHTEVKTFGFKDNEDQNVYALSLFIDHKKFTPNITRFGINAGLLRNKSFIRLVYILINVLSAFLLKFSFDSQLPKNEQKLRAIAIIGLNIGICMAFYQMVKGFQKFAGPVGRIFGFYHLESVVLSQSKRREIFETLMRNVQGICFQLGIFQIRVDAESQSDYWDFLNQGSVFMPYSRSQKECWVGFLGEDKPVITSVNIDPRDL